MGSLGTKKDSPPDMFMERDSPLLCATGSAGQSLAKVGEGRCVSTGSCQPACLPGFFSDAPYPALFP